MEKRQKTTIMEIPVEVIEPLTFNSALLITEKLIQNIACEMSSYVDVVRFMLSCRHVRNVISQVPSTHWRAHYMREFDLVPGLFGSTLREVYQTRKAILEHNKHVFGCVCPVCAADLRGTIGKLFIEAYRASNGTQKSWSNNVVRLRDLAVGSMWFLDPQNSHYIGSVHHISDRHHPEPGTPQRITYVWSLTLLHFAILENSPRFGICSAQEAQMVVYSPPISSIFYDEKTGRLFFPVLMAYAQFWRYCLRVNCQLAWSTLLPSQYPRGWQKPLTNKIEPLGTSWLGCRSKPAHDEVPALRGTGRYNPSQQYFNDETFSGAFGRTAFMGLTLAEISDNHYETPVLPKFFKEYCTAKARRKLGTLNLGTHEDPVSSVQVDLVFFAGCGYREFPFHVLGLILPVPYQEGIPGWGLVTAITLSIVKDSSTKWREYVARQEFSPSSSKSQRIQASKNFIRDAVATAWNSDEGTFDLDPQFESETYKGVILPGGKIMIGQCWTGHRVVPGVDANEAHPEAGPFIFWNLAE